MLHSYFDGGNQADSRLYKTVTLAGYSGNSRHWPFFEKRWRQALEKHNAPYLHTTDLMAGSEPYSLRGGWDESKKLALLDDCTDVIVQSHVAGKVRGVTVTVDLKDYKQIQDSGVPIISVDAICSTNCVALSMLAYGESSLKGVALFFDRGEPYCGYIRNRWNNKKTRTKYPVWNAIQRIAEVDMRVTSGLQAADLLAWSVNAAWDDAMDPGWQYKLLELARDSKYFDEEILKRPNMDV
jgi:hypothetical protein